MEVDYLISVVQWQCKQCCYVTKNSRNVIMVTLNFVWSTNCGIFHLLNIWYKQSAFKAVHILVTQSHTHVSEFVKYVFNTIKASAYQKNSSNQEYNSWRTKNHVLDENLTPQKCVLSNSDSQIHNWPQNQDDFSSNSQLMVNVIVGV